MAHAITAKDLFRMEGIEVETDPDLPQNMDNITFNNMTQQQQLQMQM